MSCPSTVAVPPSGGRKQLSMRMVVDFPAPFGPRNPSTSPLLTLNDTRSTARMGPKDLLSAFASIIGLETLLKHGELPIRARPPNLQPGYFGTIFS